MVPRIVLAIDRPTLQRQLRKKLAGGSCMVDVLQGKRRLWERMKREICDLVLISASRIPEPAADMLQLLNELPDAPHMVVLMERDVPELRAQFLVAGCQAVLDSNVPVGTVVELAKTLLTQRREAEQQRLASGGVFTQPQLRDFVSNSPVMQAFLEVVERVVNSNVSLLVLGETGVGKERLARAIHNDGPRSGGPFIAVNCGALPDTLLESELFGHEEGAFTGATRSRRGCFEMAHSGTVFLDEIGELPVHLQVKLLQVLQNREVRRLGGERMISVDVRVMAATNRDLESSIEEGQFRQDLFYRLNVMTLTLPPLRERREDIRELAINYVHYLRTRIGCDVFGITEEALEALERYQWPGNVRELINVVERAMLLCPGENIAPRELPATISSQVGAAALVLDPTMITGIPEAWLDRPWREVRQTFVEQLERTYLTGLLQRTRGRVGKTAELAGMQARSLYQKMREYGLQKEAFKI